MFRSLDDLRRAVANNKELSALDDEDLVRAYARDAEVPLDVALGYFGLRPEGTLAHWGRSLRGGGNDVKRMVGQGLQYYDKLTHSETFRKGSSQLGKDIEADADKNAFLSDTDDRQVGGVTKFVGTGLRAAVPVVPSIAGALVSTPVSVATGVGTGLMYGFSGAEEAYRRVLKTTGDEEAAFAAGNRAGMLQGAGEAAASLVGGQLIRTGRAAFGPSAKTTAEIAERMTTKPGAKEFGKAFAANAAFQVGTEVTQDVGTNEIVRAYGGAPVDNWKTAGDSAYGALALSVVLGPLMGMGHVRSRRQADQIDYMLFGNHDNEALRTKAIDLVMAEARRQNVDPTDVDNWYDDQIEAIKLAEQQRLDAEAAQTDAANRQRVIKGLAPTFSQGAGRSTAEQIGLTTGTSSERYAGPDYEQQFREAYDNPEAQEVVDAEGNLVQRTPAPGGVDSLQRAGYSPQQISEIMAERARTPESNTQQGELDLLGGSVTDAPPSARGLVTPAEQREAADRRAPYNPAQQVMPLHPAEDSAPVLGLPAPPPAVMVAGAGENATAQPVRISDLIRQRLEQREQDRARLEAQGDVVLPAGTPAAQIAPESIPQRNAPRPAAEAAAPVLGLPAPSPDVMVAGEGESATAQPVSVSALTQQRAAQREQDRERLLASGDVILPAGAPAARVAPESIPQRNAPQPPAPISTKRGRTGNTTTTYAATVDGAPAQVQVTRSAKGTLTGVTVTPEGGKPHKITKLGTARSSINDVTALGQVAPGVQLTQAAPTMAAAPANPVGLSPAPATSRTDGTDDVVGESGLSIVHGSGRADMTLDDIQIVRTDGQKQGKKGRTYGGFYGTSQEDAAQAEGYAGMMGGTPTTYDVKIKPGTKVLNKTGDVTRLSAAYINELVGQGYGMVVGKDPRGRTEYVVIDKEAIAGMAARQTDASQTTEPPAKKTRAETIKEKVAKTGSAKTTAEERAASKGIPLKEKSLAPRSLDAPSTPPKPGTPPRKAAFEPPKANKPAAEKPAAKAEKPAAEKPAAEKPAAKAEKPAAEKPAAEKPAPRDLVDDDFSDLWGLSGIEDDFSGIEDFDDFEAAVAAATPKAEKPAAEKPAAEKPAAEKPAAEKPAAEKPAAEKPAAEKPAAEKPAAEKPAAEKPAPRPNKGSGETLASDTKSDGALVATGKGLLDQSTIRMLASALVTGRVHWAPATQSRDIYNKLKAVTDIADKLSRVSGNWFRSDGFANKDGSVVGTKYKNPDLVQNAADRLEGMFTGAEGNTNTMAVLPTQLAEAIQALRASPNLTDADIDAIVAAAKASAQAQVAALTPDHQDKLAEALASENEAAVDALTEQAANAAAAVKMDVALSATWAAAKRGVFDGAVMDLADVNPGATRDSVERKTRDGAAASTPLRRAAAGTKVGKNTYTGIVGIMARLRMSGTPMERMLARSLFAAFDGASTQPKVEFMTHVKSYYDPVTDTIYLNETASPEIALHESLHAGLQWYVHSNPNAPEVVRLQQSLNKVLDLKGLRGKAFEVQTVLRELVDNNRGLDAVLELISYGTTMNEFRQVLQGMKAEQVPAGFFTSVQAVWRGIVQATQRLLGVTNTEANVVLAASMKMLSDAARGQRPGKGTGQILEAGVTGGREKARTFLSDRAARANPPANAPRGANPVGLATNARSPAPEVSDADYRAYARGPGRSLSPMKFAFELVGMGQGGKVNELVAKGADAASALIRQRFPIIERELLRLNSKFGLHKDAIDAIDRFKFDRNTGYMQMERVAAYLDAHPDVAKPFLDYMDGDANALNGVDDGGKLRAIAKSMRKMFQQYIDSLPPGSAERKHFTENKFSDYLLFAGNVKQVAGTTFGVKKLSDMVGTESKREDTLEGFVSAGWMVADSDGVVDINRKMYEVMQVGTTGAPTHVGFIDAELYNKKGIKGKYTVDETRLWRMEKHSNKFVFVTSRTASQAVAERKTQQLTTAMLNTTAALAHTYASRNFLAAMATAGRNPDGTPTPSSMAFDSIEQINEAFPGLKYPIEEKNVLQAADDAADSAQVRAQTQRSGTWVRMPGSQQHPGAYGALSGMYVPGPVWNAMLDMHDRSPLTKYRAITESVSFFKKSKTVFSPGTHTTNVLTNLTMAYLHDIPLSTTRKAVMMLAKYEVNPKSLSADEIALVQAFLDSGAMLGEFTSSEVKQTIYDALIDNITPRSDDSMLSKLQAWSAYEKAKAIGTKGAKIATDTYAAEDNVFRLAAFLNTAGNIQHRERVDKLTTEHLQEAGLAARKMFLDYDIDARAVRFLRQSVMPFISWSYAIIPVLGRMAATQPWKLANVLAAYAIVAGMLEDDEDRDAAPEFLREKAFYGAGPHMHIRAPFLGDDENPVFFNAGKYVPMFALLNPPMGDSKLSGQEWIPGFAQLGGPIPGMLMALNGMDPFTGESFHQPTDTQWDKLINTGEAVWNLMSPTPLSSRTWKDANKLEPADGESLGVEPVALYMARKLGGLGFYQFNEAESQGKQSKIAARIRADYVTAINKLKQEEMENGYPDYEAFDAEMEKLRARMLEQMNEADPDVDLMDE